MRAQMQSRGRKKLPRPERRAHMETCLRAREVFFYFSAAERSCRELRIRDTAVVTATTMLAAAPT